jgi:ankyrin repeat protein
MAQTIKSALFLVLLFIACATNAAWGQHPFENKEFISKSMKICKSNLSPHEKQAYMGEFDALMVKNGFSPALFEAILLDKMEFVKLFVQCKANVNFVYETNEGFSNTPLILALQNNAPAIVKYLIDSGADPNIPVKASDPQNNEIFMSPLVMAIQRNDLNMVKYLTSKGANVNGDWPYTPLNIAILTNSPSIVQYLIQKKANVNQTDTKTGCTTLMIALNAFGNLATLNLEIIKQLVENGANIHAKTSQLTTPLHLAAKENAKCLQYLLSKGAVSDINAQTDIGNTPLHFATRSGNMPTVQLLVENGAKINLKNKDGKTALDVASNQHIATYLLRKNNATSEKK